MARVGREGRSRRSSSCLTEEDKITQPCFEAYLNGSWWEVEIITERGEMYLIKYIDLQERGEDWCDLDNLRLRARKCDEWDCGIVRRGVDVSLRDSHPHEAFVKPPRSMDLQALYDAKVVDVMKSKHKDECQCKFRVEFYSISEDSLKKGVVRQLVKSAPAREVRISRLSILQQQCFVPLNFVLNAHIAKNWSPMRYSSDAYFLKETELKLARKSSGGQESMTTQRSDTPDISEERQVKPLVRPGTKNVKKVNEADHRPNRRMNEVDHRPNRQVNEADHRGKQSPALRHSTHPDRGVKRNYDPEEEKDSDDFQQDHSPGVVSSRDYARSKVTGGVESSKQDRNTGHRVTSTGHEALRNAGGGRVQPNRMEPKRIRRVQQVPNTETETSPDENHPENSEDVIEDNGYNSERGSNRDGTPKRNRFEEEPYKFEKHRGYQNSGHLPQKAPEKLPSGKSYGTSKPSKDPFYGNFMKSQADKAELGRFSSEKAEKGSPAWPFKAGKSEDDNSGRKRGRPSKELFKKAGPYNVKENVGSERRRSSYRLQKMNLGVPARKQKASEKGDNDPGLERIQVDLSSEEENPEDLPVEPGPRARKLRQRTVFNSKKSPSAVQKNAEKDTSAKCRFGNKPVRCDLPSASEDDDDEILCSTQEKKPKFGLKDSWTPIVEPPSDSESDRVSEKDRLERPVWPDELEPTPAVCTAQAVPVVLQDDAKRESVADHEERCDHKTFFKEDMGQVCLTCGRVVILIEDMVPEVETAQRRPRDLDEWDFDRGSPDVNQAAVGYDQTKRGEVVTMLDTCLPPHYARQMHPHQKEGFEFLWRNLGYDAEGKLRVKKADKHAGCILSHAPGTGKSFLIIAFLKSYMDKFPNTRALIVAPKIMLLRWEKEFARWKSDIRVFILNQALQHGRRRPQRHEDHSRRSLDSTRLDCLAAWENKRSVCLVSYNLFSSLTDEDANRPGAREKVRDYLLKRPGMLILDEGHFPRNKDTRIRKALMKVKTNARVLLSGTLFQNNFEELFNTLYLVRPGFVEDFSGCERGSSFARVAEAAEKKARKQFVDEIGLKIEAGQFSQGSEVSQRGLKELQRLTTSFVHHHTGEVLATLPGLRDFAILLKPTTLQCSLLAVVETRYRSAEEYLKREIAVSETSIHPKLLTKLEFKGDILNSLGVDTKKELSTLLEARTDAQDGVKTKFVFDLLRLLKGSSEKVLIFSQHISPLDLLEVMLKETFDWDKNKDVLRLDGSMAMSDREGIIERFNDASNPAKVLLASTKACGEGINLIGASRVLFLDVLWNPAVIKQAISRAFRLGQKKIVHVYRLIAYETIEEKKYKKAIRKDWLSMSIFTPAAGDSDGLTDKVEPKVEEQTDSLLDPPANTGSKSQTPSEEIHAWEVDAETCEDALLEKLLKDDKAAEKSVMRVVEHGSQFHHRKTPRGPNAKDWFKVEEDVKDLSPAKETMKDEDSLEDSPSPAYEDGGAVSICDSDEEL